MNIGLKIYQIIDIINSIVFEAYINFNLQIFFNIYILNVFILVFVVCNYFLIENGNDIYREAKSSISEK